MLLTVQILTIIVDSLLILFLLGLIILVFKFINMTSRLNKSIKNFSDFSFWTKTARSFFNCCKK